MTAVTETQARAKVCPKGDVRSYCVARACMAWRWHDRGADFSGPVPLHAPADRRGYCGLAGQVQVGQE